MAINLNLRDWIHFLKYLKKKQMSKETKFCQPFLTRSDLCHDGIGIFLDKEII